MVYGVPSPAARVNSEEFTTLERRGGQSSKLLKFAEKGSGPYVSAEG